MMATISFILETQSAGARLAFASWMGLGRTWDDWYTVCLRRDLFFGQVYVTEYIRKDVISTFVCGDIDEGLRHFTTCIEKAQSRGFGDWYSETPW